MKTGAEVKFYRRAHGFSRWRLAKMLSLRVPDLADIENERRPIPPEAEAQLPALLSLPVEQHGS